MSSPHTLHPSRDRIACQRAAHSRCGDAVEPGALAIVRDRARAQLIAAPAGLRRLDSEGDAYPVAYSERCRAALEEVDARGAR